MIWLTLSFIRPRGSDEELAEDAQPLGELIINADRFINSRELTPNNADLTSNPRANPTFLDTNPRDWIDRDRAANPRRAVSARWV